MLFAGSERIAPYVAGRAGYLRSRWDDQEVDDQTGKEAARFYANGLALSAGGGLLIRLGSRLNLDLGASVGQITFGETDVDGQTVDLGKVNQWTIRAGLLLGIGG